MTTRYILDHCRSLLLCLCVTGCITPWDPVPVDCDGPLTIAPGSRNFCATALEIGLCLETQYNDRAALWVYRLYVENCDSLSAVPWTRIAGSYHELDELDNAEVAIERALQIAPDFWHARYNNAVILHSLGLKEEALQQFYLAKDAADIPRFSFMAFEMAWDLDRTEQAMVHIKRAMELEPENADMRHRYAAFLMDLGQVQEGIHIVTELRSNESDTSYAYHASTNLLVLAHLDLGDTAIACAYNQLLFNHVDFAEIAAERQPYCNGNGPEAIRSIVEN